MKRILFISHTTRLGAGTTQSLLLLLRHLRHKYTVGVILHSKPGELSNILTQSSIPCYHLPRRVLMYLPTLISVILRENYDLVYGNNFSGRCKVALWAAKLTGRPFIWHIRESLTEKSNTRFLMYANAVLANSTHTAEGIKLFAPVHDVVTIPNGVDICLFDLNRSLARERIMKTFSLEEDSFITLNVGNICQRKNQLDVVNVVKNVVERNNNIRVIFLGDPQNSAYFELIRDKIKQLGLQGIFHFAGFQKDIAHYFVGSDILLHTAEKEPQGRVILEAMAARLPVVAYDVGGVSEVLEDGISGSLFPLGDINSISDNVIKLINSPALRNSFGENGFRIVKESFSYGVTGELVSEQIDKVLMKNR